MFLGFTAVVTPMMSQPTELSFYVGTYTSEGGSKGVYEVKMDPKTGAMETPTLVAETPNPSYLALDSHNRFLYAVDESSNGSVSAFAINPGSKLTFLNKQPSEGSWPCHLSLGVNQRSILVANYGNGALARLPIHSDGSLGAANWEFVNTGSGPNRERQEGPHAHAMYTDSRRRFSFSCDLGTDELLVFPASPGKETPRRVKLQPGAGPRHAAMNRNGRFLYVCNEMGNTVSTLAIEGPEWKEIQSLSTLPEGHPVEGTTTAEIFCHPNGRWLYVTNRGHDSIAQFSILSNGQLELVEVKPVSVQIPRGFAIDSKGKWLVVAGQNSNDIESFGIDAKSGKLKVTGSKIGLSSPVCILFAKP